MFHRRRLFIALVLTWIVGVPHCFGQSSASERGEISGTVADPAGGSIPNAVVTAPRTSLPDSDKPRSQEVPAYIDLASCRSALTAWKLRQRGLLPQSDPGRPREIPACPRAKG